MKAIVFDGSLRYVEDHPNSQLENGEALIRVMMAGICNTDLEIVKGYMGFRGIIGHEFVGVVEDVKGSANQWLGKRVVGDINCACAACTYCRQGMKTHCPARTTLGIAGRHGAFAEYLCLPVENLHEVPADVADETAVFVEPLAAAFEITEQMHIKPTHRILVLGDGKLGILAALVLSLTSAHVTLAGRHDRKMEIARRQGVNTVAVSDMPESLPYDIVVEATGAAAGFDHALRLVRPRGTVVLKSTVAEGAYLNLTPVVVNEITVMGSRCGPFEPALRALSEKKIDVRPLISGVFTPERFEEAFAATRAKDSLKVLIDFR